MIIRGGENIYPREIEEYLLKMENVLDVQAFGVYDEKFGEEICAYFRLKDNSKPFDKTKVLDFCKHKIAHYKVPKYVRTVEAFPITISGKPQKFRMRDEMNLLLKDPKFVEKFRIK